MPTMFWILSLTISYLIGSIPFGWVLVKTFTGKDIREVESGRTGGTNAMRAAGLVAGLGTALFDMLKGACAVWVTRLLVPDNIWLAVLAPVMAILGHNYSIFLLERTKDNRLRFRGGAGGAPCVGGALGLWPPSLLIILPLAGLIWYGIGYASVTTLSAGLLAMIIFAYRAYLGLSPWAYVVYGVLAEILLVWALLPNIRRLLNGTERVTGWRAKLIKRKEAQGR
jgi:acyl phosphate:glycerol-3-phosphate acyltransferase